MRNYRTAHKKHKEVKFVLEQTMKAQKGNSTLSLTSAPKCGWVVNATLWPLYPQERNTMPILLAAGWAPGLVWTGVENIASTGIRSLGHLAHFKLLY
jgi:hypothetical protein